MSSGPICHLCASAVPTVSWVTLDEESPREADRVAATGTESTDSTETGDEVTTAVRGAGGGGPREVGLCPDCLAAARARGRLLAPIIPLRPGTRRRRRSSD